MKIMIKAASDDDLTNLLLRGKRFRVMDSNGNVLRTNDPKQAITKWFNFGAKCPMETAILVATNEDANALRQCVRDNEDWFVDLYNQYAHKCPYTMDSLIDACQKEDKNKYELVDSVFPFCYG